jgi:transcriptional regulator with XRE-family HTH domain
MHQDAPPVNRQLPAALALLRERVSAGLTYRDLGAAIGVDHTTVGRWLAAEREPEGKSVRLLLEWYAKARQPPASPSADYLRGVRDAADAIRATLAELERAAADAAVIAAASAIDAELSAGDESGPTETDPGGRRTTLRLERGGSAPPADA